MTSVKSIAKHLTFDSVSLSTGDRFLHRELTAIEKQIAALGDLDLRIGESDVLFFDMDDTLIDTGYANYLAYKGAIELSMKSKFHIRFSPEKRFDRQEIRRLFPALSQTKYEEIITLKNELYLYCLPQTMLNPLVAYVLNTYRKRNTVVLVTNANEGRALQTLEYHGLLDKFDFKFFKGKDGEVKFSNKFLNALMNLGISPNNVFIIENEKSERDAAQMIGIPKQNIMNL